MLTRDEILSRHEEVSHLINWHVGRNGLRYSFVMSSLGCMDEFRSNVWYRILTTVKDDVPLEVTLSVLVVKAITWELSAIANRKRQDLLDYDDRREVFIESFVLSPMDDSSEANESLTDLMWRLRRAVPGRVYCMLWRLAGLDGKEHSMSSIGKEDGLSRERVRQLVATVAAKLEPDGNREHQKIREAAWRSNLEKSVAGRILLAEFDEHCPIPDMV